jgi:hypothetical protein
VFAGYFHVRLRRFRRGTRRGFNNPFQCRPWAGMCVRGLFGPGQNGGIWCVDAGGDTRGGTLAPPLTRLPAPQPSDLGHVQAVGTDQPPAFTSCISRLFRRKFMRHSSLMGRPPTLPGNLSLSFHVHCRKSSLSGLSHDKNSLYKD